MKNHWNLEILFANEAEWHRALDELPERVKVIREEIHRYEDGGVPTCEFLEILFRRLEEMIRLSNRAEIWLSRMIAQYPVDPYYAKLSDILNQQESGELPLMRELQGLLRKIPNLYESMDGSEYLRQLIPYAKHMCNRIIPLETLDPETGDGWYRLRALLDSAFVEWKGRRLSFRDILEENRYAEWGRELPEDIYELDCAFYEKYGSAAAKILQHVLKLDEEDYLREGTDSLTIYLREFGFSVEAVNAVIRAVEEGFPAWYDCRRSLDRWDQYEEENHEAESEVWTDPDVREDDMEDHCDAEVDEETEEETEEEINARDEESYQLLRNVILEQFQDFHPEFRSLVEEEFAGRWVWINDAPLADRDQHCSMVPELGVSYVTLSADCFLPAAAHELGHAWHNRCIRNQNILYGRNDLMLEIPSNLASLWSLCWTIDVRYSALKELRERGVAEDVYEYYRKKVETPEIYDELLGETVANLYDAYTAFCTERELRERVVREELSADDISEIYLRYRRRILPPENQRWRLDPFQWIERGSFFNCRCYYNLPYIISMLLAYRMMEDYRALEDPADRGEYWERITKLLQHMDQQPAIQVLWEFFGEDPEQVEFWRRCMHCVEKYYHEVIECVDRTCKTEEENNG